MPNGQHIQSIGTTNINWPTLPSSATKAHILPDLNPHSLVSIGVLCDHDCTATFNKHTVTVHRHNQPILTGSRLPNGLWSLPLHTGHTHHHANSLFTPQTQQKLVQWLHAAAFSPSTSTFLDAIQCNFFTTWPGLTPEIPRTHAERIVDTISFFPKVVPIPDLTHKDAAIQAARKLTHALQQPHFRGPLSQFHDTHLTSLRELSKIFHTIAPGVESVTPGVEDTTAKTLPNVPLTKHTTLHYDPPTPTPTHHPPVPPYNLRPRNSRPAYAAPVTHSETGQSMEYRDLITDPSTRATWLRSAANEFGRLAQGLPDNRVEPTNTIFFIPFNKVPKNRRPTYARFVCSYRPQKAERYRT